MDLVVQRVRFGGLEIAGATQAARDRRRDSGDSVEVSGVHC